MNEIGCKIKPALMQEKIFSPVERTVTPKITQRPTTRDRWTIFPANFEDTLPDVTHMTPEECTKPLSLSPYKMLPTKPP